MSLKRENIRNAAIVAHIDHGKTTLVDALLSYAQVFREGENAPERIMDSYDQEKERGITIFSKHTSLIYKETKINLIDTPGHSDFSGEVERVLGMVDTVLLLVDAVEGPMPQTRFVLSKALKKGLRPVVVINKIDRPHADPSRAVDLTFDLFVELGASDEQLDFPYCYASGLSGFAMREVDDPREDMGPLFEFILEKCPPPSGDPEGSFLAQASTLSYNDFLGRQATGRVLAGHVKKGMRLTCTTTDGQRSEHTVVKIEGHEGIRRVELEEGVCGDIVTISGIPEVHLGDTLSADPGVEPLAPIALDEPAVSVEVRVNNGPLAGRDGKHVTFSKIKERLLKEKRANISLLIEEVSEGSEAMRVCGRGELHLSVLLEAMRREGFECTVSKPRVITKEMDGARCEPIERVYIEVPDEFSGTIIEVLSRRKGEMQSLSVDENAIAHMEFLIPTRGLMGYRGEFLTSTRGLGILSAVFEKFAPWKGEIPHRTQGVLIAMAPGAATGYALDALQDRGILFVGPGADIYEGMVVGEHNRDNDLVVNATKGKQLTNFRTSNKDDAIQLTPPRTFNLEEAIDYIEDDELVEVTPNHIRLRKIYLAENDRKRMKTAARSN
jgi:GTP-binding protein